nr:facilitated trehalose transporter Tret1-2 homolog [Leptinotarsa decemlineata]
METKRKRLRFSYFAAASVNLMTFVAGYGFAWSSPCVPKLKEETDPAFNPLSHPASTLEISWITSLHHLGALCGPLFTGYISEKIGKKATLIMFSLPQVASNVMLIFANDVTHFYASRFLLGMGTGCVFSIIPSYVAEITETEHRGRTSMFLPLMVVSAQFLVWSIGPYVAISTLAMMCLVPSALFLIVFGLYVPESPYYFAKRNKLDEAEEALVKSGAENVQSELKAILSSVQNSKIAFSFDDFRKSKAAKKSLIIALGLMFAQQFNGHPAIAAYQQTIFGSTKGSIGPEKSVMIAGFVQLLATLVTVKFVDTVGRKKLLLFSYSALLISVTGLGTYTYLQDKGLDLSAYSWIPISCVLLNMSSFKVGSGPISWTVIGEIFPPNFKYYLNGMAAFLMTLFGFFVTFMFPRISEILGMSFSLFLFAGIVAFAIVFIGYFVPETKGKSLQEIQNILHK